MSLLMPETGLLFWMLLAFGIVFLILAKFGWPVITGMVEKRTSFINESVKLAEEANKQLENIKIETAAIIAKAHEEEVKILKEAAETRKQIIQEAKNVASEEAKKIVEATKEQIAAEKERALMDVKDQIAEISIQIAEKVVRNDLKKDNNQAEIIERLLDEIKTSH
ncbi:MAG: F0F1 ATP synthase subunit B [Paludibacteraceae bacterium]|nr:F0F1 ATP synthase subunit B [Paludibacteraceae bacterium]